MFADDTVTEYVQCCPQLPMSNTMFSVSNAFQHFIRHGHHSCFLRFSYSDYYVQGIFKNKKHKIESNKAELPNAISDN
jgi:hypothetical protein